MEFQRISTFIQEDNQWYEPNFLTTKTICNYSNNIKTRKAIINLLNKLDEDTYSKFLKKYYSEGNKRFAEYWEYHDILTILYSISKLIQPENYLEIGVRRGRSLAAVISGCSKTNAYCFDLWQKDYAGISNPDPEFVKKEIKKIGHKGTLEFFSGDSKILVPEFKKNFASKKFD